MRATGATTDANEAKAKLLLLNRFRNTNAMGKLVPVIAAPVATNIDSTRIAPAASFFLNGNDICSPVNLLLTLLPWGASNHEIPQVQVGPVDRGQVIRAMG